MIIVGSADREGYINRVCAEADQRRISPASIFCYRGDSFVEPQDDDDNMDEISLMRARLQLLELEALS